MIRIILFAITACFSITTMAQNVLQELPFLQKELVIYYSYDDFNKSMDFVDGSKNYLDGIPYRATTCDGYYKHGASFNDKNSYVETPDMPDVKSFTIMCWIYPKGLDEGPAAEMVYEKCMSYYMNILTVDGKSDKKRGHMRCGGKFSSADGSQTGWEYIDSPDTIPMNKWIHAACTFHNGDFKLYLDGALVAEKKIKPVLEQSNLKATWGAKQNPKINGFDGWFNGVIDESFIFSRALNANEVKRYVDWVNANR
ncbi:MAG: LamG domain-containing protein [Bacteroidales bacterium]|nr:LamG domain-containing protein [Bacteroidales bacterium]